MVKNMIKKTEAKLEKLHEVQELIETLTWEEGIQTFLIKQKSKKADMSDLFVHGLGIEFEENTPQGSFVMFTDFDNRITEKYSPLMLSMPEQIKEVHNYKNKYGMDEISLEFNDGMIIKIEATNIPYDEGGLIIEI